MPTNLPTWLTREYPFTPRTFVTPRGARMSYLDEGPRVERAVVMLHGNPTWSFYYRHLVQALAGQCRCVVPDHIGMGLSEKPQDYAYTLATRIADVEALLESLGIQQVDLLVHDWGGAIGFGLAGRMPARVGRIGILNTAAFPLDRIPARIAVCKAPGVGPLLVRGLNGFAGPATWMAMHRRRLTRQEKRAYLFPYDTWEHRVAVSAFVRDIPMHPQHPSWATLVETQRGLEQFRDRPITIVWGGRDFCFNDLFLAQWRQIFPAADITRLADAGHYVLEDAREDVVPQLVTFFTRSRA
ncbi:alpha/beta hydrolase [Opitutus sp. ER46]|nr:alpha/beta hydrolase [Opitutus sp. ER46]